MCALIEGINMEQIVLSILKENVNGITPSITVMYNIFLSVFIFSNFHLNGGLIYQCILHTIEAKKDCSLLSSICL